MTVSYSHKTANIFKVVLASTSIDSLLRKITVDIKKGNKFYIVTPNPEQVMIARKDEQFRKILNSANMSVVDGIGLLAARKFLKMPNPKNRILRPVILLIQGLIVGVFAIMNRHWVEDGMTVIHGRDLFLELIKLANHNGWRVYFLGGENEEALGTKTELEKNYKRVKIHYNKGPILSIDGTALTSTDEKINQTVLKEINSFLPQLLFVGFGAPKQEKWLYRHLQELKINGAMVHGGTFKYISGQVKLPPIWVDNLGLEWLWRLITGSQKINRVWTAVVTFPLQVFKHKLQEDY